MSVGVPLTGAVGIRILAGHVRGPDQAKLIADVEQIAARAPWFHPVTRWGKPMSVRLTSAGSVGWISDRRGYRYADHHPSGVSWPALPESFIRIWKAVVPDARLPDSCLINHYRDKARMGLHQDRDEADLTQPVVTVSLGDPALFRIGGKERSDPTRSLWLWSGDVAVLEGGGRLAFHGIDRIKPGETDLVPGGGRISLTLRVALPEAGR